MTAAVERHLLDVIAEREGPTVVEVVAPSMDVHLLMMVARELLAPLRVCVIDARTTRGGGGLHVPMVAQLGLPPDTSDSVEALARAVEGSRADGPVVVVFLHATALFADVGDALDGLLSDLDWVDDRWTHEQADPQRLHVLLQRAAWDGDGLRDRLRALGWSDDVAVVAGDRHVAVPPDLLDQLAQHSAALRDRRRLVRRQVTDDHGAEAARLKDAIRRVESLRTRAIRQHRARSGPPPAGDAPVKLTWAFDGPGMADVAAAVGAALGVTLERQHSPMTGEWWTDADLAGGVAAAREGRPPPAPGRAVLELNDPEPGVVPASRPGGGRFVLTVHARPSERADLEARLRAAGIELAGQH